MSYQIVVMDIEHDHSKEGNPRAWVVRTEEHVDYLVNSFTEPGIPPGLAQLRRLERFVQKLLELIPPDDPLWGGDDLQARMVALDCRGLTLHAETAQGPRLLRTVLPLARNLGLAVADRSAGLFFAACEFKTAIPECATAVWRELDPAARPDKLTSDFLTKEEIYAGFNEALTPALRELGFQRVLSDELGKPYSFPTCKYQLERDGLQWRFSILVQGSRLQHSADALLRVSSDRVRQLCEQAELAIYGKPERYNSTGIVVLFRDIAGIERRPEYAEFHYNFGLFNDSRWPGEVEWLADLCRQQLPGLLQQTASMRGLCELIQTTLQSGWKHLYYTPFEMLAPLAYLIWSGAQDDFAALAARRLEWYQQEKPEYCAEFSAIVEYCRNTLRPDPDGKP